MNGLPPQFLSGSREGRFHHRRFDRGFPNISYGEGYGYPFYSGPYYGYPYLDMPYPHGTFGLPYLGDQYMLIPFDAPKSTYAFSYTGSVSLRDVQTRLAGEGYYQGSVDGIMGPMTRQAIRSYQRDRGLAETGGVTPALLKELGLR